MPLLTLESQYGAGGRHTGRNCGVLMVGKAGKGFEGGPERLNRRSS